MQSYIPAYIRNKNRALVLDLFLKYRELTRADITKLSNISFPTVMKIVDYLLTKEIVMEVEGTTNTFDSRLGRKGQALRLNADAYSTVGIHFEGNYLLVGLVNLTNGLLDIKAFPCSDSWKELSPKNGLHQISSRMTNTIKKFCSTHTGTQVMGVGVALPGIIDGETKQVIRRKMMESISFNELFDTFREIRDLPVFIENDMNAASLGEWLLRQEEQLNSLIYLALGTGLGSGIIMDGEIWRGSANFAGNIGSMLTTYRYGESSEQVELRKIENQINIEAIKERFGLDIRQVKQAPDDVKHQISAYIGDHLIPLIYNLCYTLDMTNYVIAGVIPEFLGDILYERIYSGIQKLLFPGNIYPPVHIMPTVSKYAGIVGAAAIALQHCLTDLLGDDG